MRHLRFLFTLAMVLLLGITSANAQRKRTSSRAATTTASAATSGKWAAYTMHTSNCDLLFMTQDAKRVFFRYDYDDDATVYAIDKATGNVSEFIKFVKSYDEDAVQEEVTSITSWLDTIYVGTDKGRILEYDGKSLATSREIFKSPKEQYINLWVSADGKYLIARNKTYATHAALVQLDRRSGDVARVFKGSYGNVAFTDPSERLWAAGLAGIDVVSATGVVDSKYGKISWPRYEPGTHFGSRKRDLGDEAVVYLPEQHRVLVASGRKIFATSDSTIVWDEAAKIPANLPGNSIDVLLSNGDLTYGFTNGNDYPMLYWGKDLGEAATTVNELKSDIKVEQNMMGEYFKIIGIPNRVLEDQSGNLWMFVSGSFLTPSQLLIFNPDGIKGLSATRGKYTPLK